MPAQQHLPRRSAVHEDHAWLIRAGIGAAEQLALDFRAVGGLEGHGLRNHQLCGREIGRNQVGLQRALMAAVGLHHRNQRRPLRARVDVGDGTADRGGRGLDVGTRGQCLRVRAIHRNPEQVPAIVVVLRRAGVGAVNDRLSIGRHRDIFHHELAGRQQQGCAATCRDRVQVRPVVEVGEEHQACTIIGPVQVGAPCGFGIRAEQGVRALPDHAALSGACVRDADRPRLRRLLEDGLRRSTVAGLARERDPRAVGRPARIAVVAGRRRQVQHRRAVVGEHANESMVAAVRHERQAFAVRRPMQVAILAAIEEQPLRLGLVLCIERRGPHLIVLDEGELAGGRERGCIAFGQFAGSPDAQVHRPQHHLGFDRAGRWIGLQLFRPVGVMIAAAHEHQLVAGGRERQLREFLAVVGAEVRDLARLERGRLRDPHVARATKVHDPCDAVAMLRGRQALREGISEDLLQVEPRIRRCALRRWRERGRGEQQGDEDERATAWHGISLRLGQVDIATQHGNGRKVPAVMLKSRAEP